MAWERRGTPAALTIALLLLAPLAADATVLRVVSGLVGAEDQKSRELVALPPSAAGRIARRDLLSVLRPADKFKLTNGSVEGTTFVTWPYETEYRYVCREDRITLHYRSAGHFDAAGKFLDYQLQPQGIDAQPLFHIGQLPVPGFTPGTEYPETICDARHPDAKARWIAAPDATDAVRAANMFRMAEDEVRSGRLTPGPCDPHGSDTCRQWVVSLDDPSKIASIERCATSASDDACYIISFDTDEQMTIRGTIPAKETAVTPIAITSLQMDKVLTIFE